MHSIIAKAKKLLSSKYVCTHRRKSILVQIFICYKTERDRPETNPVQVKKDESPYNDHNDITAVLHKLNIDKNIDSLLQNVRGDWQEEA